jgi:hypothetical protein
MLLQASYIMNNLQTNSRLLWFNVKSYPHFAYLVILQATQLLFHHTTVLLYQILKRNFTKSLVKDNIYIYGYEVFKAVDLLDLLLVFSIQMRVKW